MKPSTYDLYESLIDKVINPQIGKLKLKDIKPIHIRAFYNKLYTNGKGYATSTIQKINNILCPALKIAVKNDLIVKNPLEVVEMPKHKEKQVRALSVEEQNLFIKSAEGNWYLPAFIIAMDTGLRTGELLALNWDDVDLKSGEINVNKNLIAVKDRDSNDGKQILKIQETPKTAKSVR